MSYYISSYELDILADIININLVIIGRKTQKNPDGLEIINNNSNYYLFLLASYNRFEKHDIFEIIAKHKKLVLLKKKDIPSDFMNIIINKSKVFEIEVSPEEVVNKLVENKEVKKK